MMWRDENAGLPPNVKRVAHVLPFPGVGGTEIGQVRLMRAAAKAGYDNFAICLDYMPDLRDYLEQQGVTAIPWKAPDPSFKRGPRFLLDSWRLASEFRRRNVDLIHCADVLAAYHAALAGRLAGIPVLCHVRSRRSALSSRDLLFIGRANHFAFVSRQTRRIFALPLPEEKTTILYDGIRVPEVLDPVERARLASEVRRELGLRPSALLAGMFGRIAPARDFSTLVKAARELRDEFHRDLRVVLVGDYTSMEATREHAALVQKEIADAGIKDMFCWTGFRSDVTRLMQAMDVFVLSSHSEGLPLVILEAMACGIPAVATAVDGVPEIITDGQNGRTVPHGDAPALARALRDLLSDRNLAVRLGEAGREHVARFFSEEAFASNVAALYARLV